MLTSFSDIRSADYDLNRRERMNVDGMGKRKEVEKEMA